MPKIHGIKKTDRESLCESVPPPGGEPKRESGQLLCGLPGENASGAGAEYQKAESGRSADLQSLRGECGTGLCWFGQYRYSIDDYIYEFPAGLVEPGENFREAAVRELREETGLTLTPLSVDEKFEKPYYTTIGMTDESCCTVYGYASGQVNLDRLGGQRGAGGGFWLTAGR